MEKVLMDMPELENVPKKNGWQKMKAELRNVIWPSGKDVTKSTFVTISFVLLIAVVLAALNLAFNGLSNLWWKLIIK